MTPLKLGIIGAGAIAQQHLSILQALEDVKAVGITSRTAAKAQDLAGRFGITGVYNCIEDLVTQARPDALMVLVSVDQVEAVVRQLLPFRLPMFIEKPAGLSAQANLGLLEAARRYGVGIMVGLNRRFYSVFHQGIDIIRQHGPLMGVCVQGHERIWRQHQRTDDHFKNIVLPHWVFANSIHTIDLLRFFGGEIAHLTTITHRYSEPLGDQFAALMEFAGGAIGQYSAFWHSPGGWAVTLYGKGVTVMFEPLEQGRWVDEQFQSHPLEPDQADQEFKPGFYKQAIAFRNFVVSGRLDWPAQDLQGSYQSMQIARQMTKDISQRSLTNSQ